MCLSHVSVCFLNPKPKTNDQRPVTGLHASCERGWVGLCCRQLELARNRCMGGLQKLVSGLGRFHTYKGGVQVLVDL